MPPSGCIAYDGVTELAAPWCKVKAMLAAMDARPDASLFLYLDSDAAIAERLEGSSIEDIARLLERDANWPPTQARARERER